MTSCVTSDGGQNTPDDSGDDQVDQQDSEQPSGKDQPPEDPVAQSITSSTKIGTNFRVEVISLDKHDDDFAVVRFSMANLSDSEDAYTLTPPKDRDNPSDFQSMTLIDTRNQTKHIPLFYKNGECFCGKWNKTSLAPGDRMTTWLAFPAPPDDVDSMTLLTAVTPPILDIPITDATTNQPADGELADPRIWDLHSFSEEVDGTKSREETPDQMAVSLSSDVLFDLNESDLNEDADQILEQVSKEIDNSSATSVSIDGHTDNTGTDSVNIPLSEERAEVTKNRISRLTSNSDITYEVDGHGSTDPIASNDTDKGRAKNRRVTITFNK
ncbi:hypothetical protein GCM10023405_07290 [Streptomonospora salina]